MQFNQKLIIFLIAVLTLYLSLVTWSVKADTTSQRAVVNNGSTSTIAEAYNNTSEALQYSKAIIQMIEDFIREDLTTELQSQGEVILENTKVALGDCENQLHTFSDITNYNQCAEFLLHSSLLSLANLKRPGIPQGHPTQAPPTAAASAAARMKLFW